MCIRPRLNNEAELKRLYVKPNHQGDGIGKKLLHLAMLEAKKVGFESIVLDTLPMMETAKLLYLNYGFKKTSAYYENPGEGVEYFKYLFS